MMTPDGSRAWSSAGAAHRSGWAAAASGKSVLIAGWVISGGRDGVSRNGRAVEGGERGGPEPLDGQVHADGELEDGHGKGAQKAGTGRLPPAAEDRHGVPCQDDRGADEADHRDDAAH